VSKRAGPILLGNLTRPESGCGTSVRRVGALLLLITLSACASVPVPVSLTAMLQLQLQERAGTYPGDWILEGTAHLVSRVPSLDQQAQTVQRHGVAIDRLVDRLNGSGDVGSVSRRPFATGICSAGSRRSRVSVCIAAQDSKPVAVKTCVGRAWKTRQTASKRLQPPSLADRCKSHAPIRKRDRIRAILNATPKVLNPAGDAIRITQFACFSACFYVRGICRAWDVRRSPPPRARFPGRRGGRTAPTAAGSSTRPAVAPRSA
jgi:hypothetical protein